MKHLKIAVIFILMMLAMCACSRLESSQIDISNFLGAWQEYFGPDYHVELPVKVLAFGSIDKAINVKVNAISEKAKSAIEAAGGKVEII